MQEVPTHTSPALIAHPSLRYQVYQLSGLSDKVLIKWGECVEQAVMGVSCGANALPEKTRVKSQLFDPLLSYFHFLHFAYCGIEWRIRGSTLQEG